MRSFRATCRDCGAQRNVRRFELDRAAKPRCLKCGGPLELSGAATASLGEVNAAQAGERNGDRRRKPQSPEARRIIPDKPMARHEWWEWPDLYRWAHKDAEKRGHSLEGLTWQYFYEIDTPCRENDGTDASFAGRLVRRSERELFRAAKPYFKVWPQIAGALCDTEIRIAGEYFHMPYGAIEIRLPKADNPLAPLGACICARLERDELGHQDDRDWSFVVATFWGLEDYWDRDNAGHYLLADIPIRPRQLLEDSLNETRLLQELAKDKCGHMAGLVRSLVRIAVGVCFFGVDKHELILPDLPRRVIERYQRERREPSTSEAEKILRQAKEAGLFGFKVGSEIDLPTARINHHPAPSTAEHRELTAGHVRRGHLRRQACGAEHKEHRIIFVAPHLVRPDLPLQSTHGYRIRVPKGKSWTPNQED